MTSTITDTQIKALRREARKAGDGLMADICAVALADGLGAIAEIDEANRAALEQTGIIPEHVGADEIARRECARQRRRYAMRRWVYAAVPGYSAYDHYADEVIRVAQQILQPGATRRQMESAAARAWRQVRPHAASGPRIVVVAEGGAR